MGQKRQINIREKELMIFRSFIYVFLPTILCLSFVACQEEEIPKNTLKELPWDHSLVFEYGFTSDSYLDITTHMYISNENLSIKNRTLIIAFASTEGSSDDLVIQLSQLADVYDAIVISPQIDAFFRHGWSPYFRLIDSLLVHDAVNPEAVFMSGYSSGAGSALTRSKEYGRDVIKGDLLLATGRGVGLNEDLSTWHRLPKICQCTGTDDITYEANKKLHQLFLENGVNARIFEVPDYSHGDMLSKEYLSQQIQCFEYLKN